MNGFRFISQNWATVTVCFFVLLPTGATACVELKRFEEAISWCDKGLVVSFEGIVHFLIIWCFKGENTKKGMYYDGNLSGHILKVCVIKNIGEVITSWLINEITPFSQFDLVLLSMPITGTLV